MIIVSKLKIIKITQINFIYNIIVITKTNVIKITIKILIKKNRNLFNFIICSSYNDHLLNLNLLFNFFKDKLK